MPPEASISLRDVALRTRSVLLPVLIVGLVLVIVIPVPAGLMDLLLSASIAFSVLVLLTTIYVSRPLDFSVFPTILLGATLARLVFNFASTRLILTRAAEDGTGAAGGVIESFGNFVTGGEVAVGVILFTILVVVQFLVITRGSTRISEVAARFALDAMPGRQMAIDADVAAGVITREEAHERRNELEGRADFYAAMDGAGKFVRGDAIAGIVITLTNICGGLYVGVVNSGMSFGRAVDVFTRLTIGDGLVTQVPALLVSLAAGLIVTRSSTSQHLPQAVFSQLFGHSEALLLAAAFLAVLAMTGLPAAPLLGLAALCVVTGLALRRRGVSSADSTTAAATNSEAAATPTGSPGPATIRLDANSGPSPFVEPLELELGSNLLGLAHGQRLIERLGELRHQLARELGCLLPDVVIRDNLQLDPQQYQFRVRGVVVNGGRLWIDRLLVVETDATAAVNVPAGAAPGHDPKSGRHGWWVDPASADAARHDGHRVLDPATLLLRHLGQVVRRHAAELLGRQQVHQLLDRLSQQAPRLVEELVPGLVSTSQLHRVLGSLLSEGVPIRDLETILETLGDHAETTTDVVRLTALVRVRLARSICQQYRDADRRLRVLTLDPDLEERIEEHSRFSATGLQTWLSPGLTDRLLEELAAQFDANENPPVVLCSSSLVRAALKHLTDDRLPQLVAMSLEEISRDTQVESLGQVCLPLSDTQPLAA